jgi:hypothetical protein
MATSSYSSSKSNGEYLDLEPRRIIGSGSFGNEYFNYIRALKRINYFL